MPDRLQCHTEYAKTWIQEKTLRSEPETLDLKLFSHGCSLGGISKHGPCSLQKGSHIIYATETSIRAKATTLTC